jgi:ferrochelatase
MVTSAYSSYSGCRQYREDILRAQEEVGPGAPQVDKLRMFFNHPCFIDAWVDRLHDALGEIPSSRHPTTRIVFTAHSLPTAMADGCQYTAQLTETCRLVSERVTGFSWDLVYQSRSGPPHQPWLEPDVCDHLQQLHARKACTDVVVAPIGFLSDHMEVIYDLDTEARQLCEQRGLNMVRAQTPGTHAQLIQMIRELILERLESAPKRALGNMGPSHDQCPTDCCPSGRPAHARRPTT